MAVAVTRRIHLDPTRLIKENRDEIYYEPSLRASFTGNDMLTDQMLSPLVPWSDSLKLK